LFKKKITIAKKKMVLRNFKMVLRKKKLLLRNFKMGLLHKKMGRQKIATGSLRAPPLLCAPRLLKTKKSIFFNLSAQKNGMAESTVGRVIR
jgi:hypothetical protein